MLVLFAVKTLQHLAMGDIHSRSPPFRPFVKSRRAVSGDGLRTEAKIFASRKQRGVFGVNASDTREVFCSAPYF